MVRKMVIFGFIIVIIDGSLYGRVLGYSSMDFIFLSHMEWTILKLWVGVLCLKNLINCNFDEFLKKIVFFLT